MDVKKARKVHLQQLKELQCFKLGHHHHHHYHHHHLVWYVKDAHLLCERYTKGVSFLSKMLYKRVRGWTSGKSLPV